MKYYFFILSIGNLLFIACQQENNNGSTNAQKPKLGTRWLYRYTLYYSNGGLDTSYNVVYKAVSKEMLGGEEWFKIIDSTSGSTIFYLNEKTGGLFQYIGNASNLLCKYPAAINNTYRSFLTSTDSADYFVRAVNDTLSLGLVGDVPVIYYEGISVAVGGTADKLWYNKDKWLVQRYIYRKLLQPLGGYYRNVTLILQDFTY